jgi:hypothetical protein
MERAIVVLSNDGMLLCEFSGWYSGAQSVEMHHRKVEQNLLCNLWSADRILKWKTIYYKKE